MMTPEADTGIVDLTEIVGDHEIRCDYSDMWDSCPSDAARWVARTALCPCGFSAARLICTTCKDFVMLSEDAVWCGGMCGEIYIPARLGYASIEPLDKKS